MALMLSFPAQAAGTTNQEIVEVLASTIDI